MGCLQTRGTSLRQFCRVIGLSTATWRYQRRTRATNVAVLERLQVRARFGYRRLHILLEREGTRDEATVRVECDPAVDQSDYDALTAELAERVRRKLKTDTEITFRVEILRPYTLERAISKAKRVDDRRPKYRPAGSE